jgi:hypothetical protein
MTQLLCTVAAIATKTATKVRDIMTTTYTDEPEPPSLRALSAERPWRFSWGAVIAGAVISLGLWMLLHVLGMGAGLTAIDPDDMGSLRGVGMGTGIWSLIVPLVAMLLGGFAAAKVAGPVTRMGAAVHGAALWSLATLVGTMLVVSLVSSILGGAARVGSQAIGAAGRAVSDAPADVLGQAGISTDDLLAPVNERLRAAGKPPITAEQLGAVTRDALRTAVREGRLDRDVLTTSLAQNTAMTEADAREIATTLEGRYQRQASELRRDAEQAGSAALQAAETTGKGLIGLFFAMLLGLAAAIGGTLLGVTRAQLAVAERASARAERLVGRHA